MKIKKPNHTLCKIHKKEYCEDLHCFWEGQERIWSLIANCQWLNINVAKTELWKIMSFDYHFEGWWAPNNNFKVTYVFPSLLKLPDFLCDSAYQLGLYGQPYIAGVISKECNCNGMSNHIHYGCPVKLFLHWVCQFRWQMWHSSSRARLFFLIGCAWLPSSGLLGLCRCHFASLKT